jgi:hypothetical protein
MQAVPTAQAIERLMQAVEDAHPDDLVEIYNELFPGDPIGEDEARRDRTALVRRIVDHIRNGLQPEEIVDLWNVIFPEHSGVWFDDEENRIVYNEERGTVRQAD